ncbi:hypothetical protein CK203_079340 [Vitis vinifera]|uniref:Reverse transcriptase zinc-binding domain-containing protein n=1 Tax=Vitis vinifera TaxID=29760 RepID=A0A438DGR2_VITVI|nr:hypothetical protein CK203_079340 [Vitis vinifera]
MGFGSKWLGWMWSYLSSAKFSVLVNGVPVGFFPSAKGLRQGDPLSPYLFVLGMEVLDALIWRVVAGRFLSGLKINLAKSEIIPVGEVDEIDELAMELGCKVGPLPSQYLGLPLRAQTRLILCGMGWRRLALWKRQYISKGGRITLIKSTLASMPIYQMSLFRMSMIVARRIRGGFRLKEASPLEQSLAWAPKSDSELNVWCTGTALSQNFPHLFAMVVHRNGYGDLLHGLRGHRPSLEEDSVFWKGGRNGQFRVKETYSLLANPNDTAFPTSCIWVDRVPTKVAFFAWEATWGKVFTLDRL